MELKALQTQYRRYILYLANRIAFNEIDREDLYSEGLIGLWEAQQLYSEDKGTFHSFVIMRMKGRMMKFMTNNSRTIRIPANQQLETRRTVESLPSTISMETSIGEEGTIEDLLGKDDEQFYDKLDDQDDLKLRQLRHYYSELKPEYQKIIYLYQNEDMTFSEIGQQFGMTGENIRVKYYKGLEKIKKKFD
jgi:RNA polymerase sigma factor (sigma-70 family)